MKPIQPRTFSQLSQLDVVSPGCMTEHLRLYAGYVERYNQLAASLGRLQRAGAAEAGADVESVKVDLTFALGAVKNHELFFDVLGLAGESRAPGGALGEAITGAFGGFGQFLSDLRQTAIAGAGWAWTAYDLDYGHLFNYSGARNGMPVWNAAPILAIDLYGHAYLYDFGENKGAYVDAVVACLNWGRIGQRFEAAQSRSF
ncbi:MAG TPA: Fe-Mn family superoxide dismutase [Phycisphaerae bacterium]|nr:Fe-Mn family superoxide dismutase [Phycisphaerae bacterium]